MGTAREQMKLLDDELARIRGEIERLRTEEAALARVAARMRGEAEHPPSRTRSPSVKPLVLDIMRRAAETGATTQEVDEEVRRKIPTVAKETVGSVLSRLKGDGALVYDGERYYEKQFAPKSGTPIERSLRAVT